MSPPPTHGYGMDKAQLRDCYLKWKSHKSEIISRDGDVAFEVVAESMRDLIQEIETIVHWLCINFALSYPVLAVCWATHVF